MIKTFNYIDYPGDTPNDKFSKMGDDIYKTVLSQKNGGLWNDDYFKFTMNLDGCPQRPEGYFNGVYIGYLFVDLGGNEMQGFHMDATVNCPDDWTNIDDISQTYINSNSSLILRINAKGVKKINGLFGMIGEGLGGPDVNILDLSGLTNCTEIHRLFKQYEGATSHVRYNVIEHIIYPPTENIVSAKEWFYLDMHSNYNPRISFYLIQEFLSLPWPKLKDLSNFIYIPEGDLLTSYSGEAYPKNIRFYKNYPYTDKSHPVEFDSNGYYYRILDFGNLTAIETLENFFNTGYYSRKSTPYFSSWSIRNLGRPDKIINTSNMFRQDNEGNIVYQQFRTISCQNLYNIGFVEVTHFLHFGPGATGASPRIGPNAKILWGGDPEWAYLYSWMEEGRVVINTGDPAKDNEVKNEIPNATVGIPAGWTHIFAAT